LREVLSLSISKGVGSHGVSKRRLASGTQEGRILSHARLPAGLTRKFRQKRVGSLVLARVVIGIRRQ
jgi:hypothetical protein